MHLSKSFTLIFTYHNFSGSKKKNPRPSRLSLPSNDIRSPCLHSLQEAGRKARTTPACGFGSGDGGAWRWKGATGVVDPCWPPREIGFLSDFLGKKWDDFLLKSKRFFEQSGWFNLYPARRSSKLRIAFNLIFKPINLRDGLNHWSVVQKTVITFGNQTPSVTTKWNKSNAWRTAKNIWSTDYDYFTVITPCLN